MTAPETQFDPDSARFGASRSQKRVEDERLLAGKGLYSDDRVFPNQAWLVLLRSPHAHATIVSLDLAPVRAAPGVLAAWTVEDLKRDGVRHLPFPPIFKRADGSPMAAPLRTLLAEGKVFYVGQPVAAIIAETREHAQDAAELALVEYEDLPCVTDAREAARTEAPQIWAQAPGNVSAQARIGNVQAVEEAFLRAAHVTRLSLHNQRLIAMALEPRCSIAVHENDRFTLYTQNQTPTGARDGLAAALGGKPADYRLIVGDIGGGFGMKTGVANEDALVCHAARKLGRPVKWRADRSEDFLAAHMGRDQHYDAELALDREGRILALRLSMYANFGATPVGSTAIIPMLLAPKVQTTVYHVPAVDYCVYGMLTNTMATGAYRGAGRPEANYLMERLIEQAAREMKLDSAEIRRRNFIRPEQFPYRTHVDDWYDAGEFARVLDQALAAADWKGFDARREEAKRRGRLRGRGLACYLEWTGAPIRTETVDVQVDADGTVSVYTGTQAMGQGLETMYTQLIMEVLQIPAQSVRVIQGDTDAATGVGSVGSRSAFVGGSAAVAAGRRAILRGKELAADALESSAADIEYRDGRFAIAGTDRSLTLAEIAASAPERRIRVSATETPSTPSWPNGAQVCEIEVDPQTGEIEVASITSVDDIGRIINHMIVEGQVHGGIAQGLGQALFEHAVYDPASGQLLTGSLMDYCVPRADQMPPMSSGFNETVPCKTNLLGVKGCGEIGTIGAVPAAVHAVLDALAGHGVSHLEMPLTPERIWRALQGGKA
ncbi:MAG TPA: xanthine dehydrogenase family protein molybdopterin-binding subunit [Burkholderiales bacterium]|nr:xanthine dehydrogenase family protein molybdopterin-binding subunit [Burkholderiales bacterium]